MDSIPAIFTPILEKELSVGSKRYSRRLGPPREQLLDTKCSKSYLIELSCYKYSRQMFLPNGRLTAPIVPIQAPVTEHPTRTRFRLSRQSSNKSQTFDFSHMQRITYKLRGHTSKYHFHIEPRRPERDVPFSFSPQNWWCRRFISITHIRLYKSMVESLVVIQRHLYYM